MKRYFWGAIGLILFILLNANSVFAGQFTVTMPPGQSVTMNDPIDTLSFVVTNTDNNGFINSVTFTFPNTLYYVEWDTVPPTNWTATFNNNQVTFSTTSNPARIQPNNGTKTFNIRVKGPGWTNLVRSNNDTTDTLQSVTASGTEAFTLSGALPTWLRRSLAVTIVGYPDAVGIGQSFILVMQVENRSLQAKNGITAAPSPPTPNYGGGASVTNTAGPTYDPNPLNLAAGAQGSITYTYRADAEGTVYFTGGAFAAGATSKTATSNTIVINPLAVSLSVAPTSVANGQNVTVTMTVQGTGRVTTLSSDIDNAVTTIPAASTATFPLSGTIIIDSEEIAYTGTTATSFTGCIRGVNSTTAASHLTNATVRSTLAFGNIVPSLSTLGTATKTLVSGPTPATIASIAPGESGTFQWVYTITGITGQTYQFQGFVTADGPITSNTAASELGQIANYSLTLSPDTIATGSTNVTISFTFYSGASTIRSINLWWPDTSWGAWYQNGSTTVTCSDGNSSWAWSAIGNDGVRLSANNVASRIANGQSCTFNLRFTNVPTVTTDTNYAFYSDLYSGNFTGWLGTLQGILTITAYAITLTHAPAGPINADGTSTYTMTATLTAGGSPLANKTIAFTTTAGTLSSSTAITNASGIATVTLTAPVSSTDINATVKAIYIKTKATDTVSFTGVTTPNLQYVGGTLTPPHCLQRLSLHIYTSG